VKASLRRTLAYFGEAVFVNSMHPALVRCGADSITVFDEASILLGVNGGFENDFIGRLYRPLAPFSLDGYYRIVIFRNMQVEVVVRREVLLTL
jgi:hypothetical protein